MDEQPDLFQEPAPFLLVPGAFVGDNQPIDYSTRSGQALFNQGIKALPLTFDGTTAKILPFLNGLHNKAAMMGWDDIFLSRNGWRA